MNNIYIAPKEDDSKNPKTVEVHLRNCGGSVGVDLCRPGSVAHSYILSITHNGIVLLNHADPEMILTDSLGRARIISEE